MKITPELVQRIMLARPSIEAMSNWVADELNRLAAIENNALVYRARLARAKQAGADGRISGPALAKVQDQCPHYTGRPQCDICGKEA